MCVMYMMMYYNVYDLKALLKCNYKSFYIYFTRYKYNVHLPKNVTHTVVYHHCMSHNISMHYAMLIYAVHVKYV